MKNYLSRKKQNLHFQYNPKLRVYHQQTYIREPLQDRLTEEMSTTHKEMVSKDGENVGKSNKDNI